MSAQTIIAAEHIPSPLAKKERILFLDSVRGMALLGILIMNITAQAQSHYFYSIMNLNQPITGPNLYVWAAEMGLFEGTMRGLFSILFGAGSILLLTRLEKNSSAVNPADIYYRRIFWLLLFGVVNAYIFLWPGDILYAYAICGLVLFPFRHSSVKTLVIITIIIFAFGSYRDNAALFRKKNAFKEGIQAELLVSQHKKLNKDQTAALKKWQGIKERANPKGLMKQAQEETITIQKANFSQLFVYLRDANVELQSTGFYNSWWDMLIFFFIGMIVYKTGFLTGGSPLWLYLTIGIIGTTLGIGINYWIEKADYIARFDGVKFIEHAPFELYTIRRIVQTLGYLSLLILLYKVNPLRYVFHIFAPVGQMAFTNYLSQSIFAAVIFYGFGLFGNLQRYQIYEIMLCIWAFQIMFSNIWLRYFLFGPFEWLWRSLTYQKLQPFVRARKNIQPETVSLTAANL